MTSAGANPLRRFLADNAMRRAMAWAATFAVAWAVLELALGAQLRGSYNLLQIVWWRYAAHLCVVALLWGRLKPGVWRTSRPVTHQLRSLLMLVMPGAFTLAVMQGVSPEFVWSVFWIAPALIIGLAWVFLRERPPLAVAAACLGGALAAAAIFGHLRPPSMTALLLALGVTGSFSLYAVMTRSLRSEPVSTNLLYTALAVFALLTPAMPFVWVRPDLHDAVVMTLIGVVGFGALYALDRACHAAPLWASAGALFAQAVCVAVLVVVATGGHPSHRVLFGTGALLALIAGLWFGAGRLFARRGATAGQS